MYRETNTGEILIFFQFLLQKKSASAKIYQKGVKK